LRVDAVASMLYRDYSRENGQWIPNEHGGRENWDAVAVLRAMNQALYASHPGIITIAEESTSWPGVSHPADGDAPGATALGFGFKWNMGFMHDTLQYMARDPVHRRHHHDEITFGLVYAFSENFVLPLSHDEVVHGKGSLLTKMPGDDWQKFANLRAYYGMMWGYPGKKLLFMGQEFAQRREWSEERGLDWPLRSAAMHEGVRNLVRDLNRLYTAKPALHARDCEAEGFEWLIADDRQNSVFAWLRKAPGANPVAVVCNMTPAPHDHYRLPLPHDGTWREIFNSDAQVYGGSGQGNHGTIMGQNGAVHVILPPLATIMFEYDA
jgi:1,4-alpha-glucan branching enzyme